MYFKVQLMEPTEFPHEYWHRPFIQLGLDVFFVPKILSKRDFGASCELSLQAVTKRNNYVEIAKVH